MSVCRRVKDDALICVASLCLPACELECILDNPSYVVQTAGLHVSASPGDNLAYRVEMGHVRSCCLGGERCGSSICEQVEDLRLRLSFSLGLLDQFSGLSVDILPV